MVGHYWNKPEETEKCFLQVLVEKPEGRGITGWALLLSGAKEKPDYGLYSYILFGSRPTDASRSERYLKTLEAYVSLAESIASLEASGIARHRLNITYLPVHQRARSGDRSASRREMSMDKSGQPGLVG
jgi:hypothetical protein